MDSMSSLPTTGVRPVGLTHLISPGSSSPRFHGFDRRLYSPLCLTLAALAAPAARRTSSA
jgi:hypothetical protein